MTSPRRPRREPVPAPSPGPALMGRAPNLRAGTVARTGPGAPTASTKGKK